MSSYFSGVPFHSKVKGEIYKMNKEKQKLIRLVALKSDKKFSKTKKENYKIGAVISNLK